MVDVATDEAEGGQALFCYIADILGENNSVLYGHIRYQFLESFSYDVGLGENQKKLFLFLK